MAASVVIVAVGGYVFKTLKATGKFDKVIEGLVKIKSNAKQLITNGLTRANNFIQGISIPFTGWIKDAFGSIISKAKGFVTYTFNKYAPKPVQSMVTPDGVKVPIVQEIAQEGVEHEIKEETKESLKNRVIAYLKNAIANGTIGGPFDNNISFTIDENTVINFRKDVGVASHGLEDHFNIQIMTRRKNGKMRPKFNPYIFVDVDSNGRFKSIKRIEM